MIHNHDNWVKEAKAVEELRSKKVMLQAAKFKQHGYLKEAQEQVKVVRDLSQVQEKLLEEKIKSLEDELKKNEGSKHYFLDKIDRFEKGEVIIQQATNITMKKFFASKAWINT